MKLLDKPSKEELDFIEKMKSFYSYEEICNLLLTFAGANSLLLEFMAQRFPNAKKLPESAMYGFSLGAFHLEMLSKVVRGELDKKDVKLRHMPIEEDGWKSETKISERMKVIVNQLYSMIHEKEKGKT